MDGEASPAVRRRRLAAELRGLRQDTGRTAESLARELGWSPSKVSRYEAAKTGLRPADVRRLLRHLGVSGARRRELLALAEDATGRGWWDSLGGTLPPDRRRLIGLEHEAATIALWHLGTVPELLQTAAYARCAGAARDAIEPLPPARAARLVEATLRRQRILDRPGLRVHAVLDESVLARRIGPDTVMREQLQRLASDAIRDNVTIQVLPLDSPRPAVGGESFELLGFGAGDDGAALCDVAIAEQLDGGRILEGEHETHLRRLAFRALAAASLSPPESRHLILKTAGGRWAASAASATE